MTLIIMHFILGLVTYQAVDKEKTYIQLSFEDPHLHFIEFNSIELWMIYFLMLPAVPAVIDKDTNHYVCNRNLQLAVERLDEWHVLALE